MATRGLECFWNFFFFLSLGGDSYRRINPQLFLHLLFQFKKQYQKYVKLSKASAVNHAQQIIAFCSSFIPSLSSLPLILIFRPLSQTLPLDSSLKSFPQIPSFRPLLNPPLRSLLQIFLSDPPSECLVI